MTTEEIQQNNILIALFMGAKILDKPIGHTGRDIQFPGITGGLFVHQKSDMKYHTSWDWLMPVVIKISDCRYPDYYGPQGKTKDDGDYDDCAYPRTFGMRDKEGNYMVRINASVLITAPTLIEAAYLAVVDFITWHNENQKP